MAGAAMLPGVEATRVVLVEGLRVAVPLWVARHHELGTGQSRWRADHCARFVSERGDQLLFRMKKRGRSQEVFNRLAEGLALLALQTGEAAAFGLTFTIVEGRCVVSDGDEVEVWPQPRPRSGRSTVDLPAL